MQQDVCHGFLRYEKFQYLKFRIKKVYLGIINFIIHSSYREINDKDYE